MTSKVCMHVIMTLNTNLYDMMALVGVSKLNLKVNIKIYIYDHCKFLMLSESILHA